MKHSTNKKQNKQIKCQLLIFKESGKPECPERNLSEQTPCIALGICEFQLSYFLEQKSVFRDVRVVNRPPRSGEVQNGIPCRFVDESEFQMQRNGISYPQHPEWEIDPKIVKTPENFYFRKTY